MSTFGFDGGPQTPAFPKQPLLIELVPSGSWGDNLRSRFTKARWDSLRKAQYLKAAYRCEICGESGKDQGCNWPVECHEVWKYDDSNHIQTLERLIALCPRCHKVKHAGRTINVDGPSGLEEVTQRLMRVNGWTEQVATQHLQEAFALWTRRSQFEWTLDITAVQP